MATSFVPHYKRIKIHKSRPKNPLLCNSMKIMLCSWVPENFRGIKLFPPILIYCRCDDTFFPALPKKSGQHQGQQNTVVRFFLCFLIVIFIWKITLVYYCKENVFETISWCYWKSRYAPITFFKNILQKWKEYKELAYTCFFTFTILRQFSLRWNTRQVIFQISLWEL